TEMIAADSVSNERAAESAAHEAEAETWTAAGTTAPAAVEAKRQRAFTARRVEARAELRETGRRRRIQGRHRQRQAVRRRRRVRTSGCHDRRRGQTRQNELVHR